MDEILKHYPAPYTLGYNSGRKGEMYQPIFFGTSDAEKAEQHRVGWEHGSRMFMLRAARNQNNSKEDPFAPTNTGDLK